MQLEVILDTVFNEHLIDNVNNTGNYFKSKLHSLEDKYKHVENVRGKGTFLAFDLENEQLRDKLVTEVMDQGVQIGKCGDRSIRFRPTLTVQKYHVDICMDTMEKVLKTW